MFGFLGNIACSIDRDISEANLQQSFYIRQCKPFYKSGHPVQDRETGDIYFTFVKKYGSTSSLFNQFILFVRNRRWLVTTPSTWQQSTCRHHRQQQQQEPTRCPRPSVATSARVQCMRYLNAQNFSTH